MTRLDEMRKEDEDRWAKKAMLNEMKKEEGETN